MKKTYLEPETKVYEQKVEGHLLAGSGIEGSTSDPKQGGDPTHQNRSVNNPSQSSAKKAIEWDI